MSREPALGRAVQSEHPALSTPTPEPATGAPPRRSWLRLVLVAAAVVAAVALTRVFEPERHLLDFVAWIRGAGATGMLLFALAYVLACVLFLPGSILTLGAGRASGGVAQEAFYLGGLVATVAVTLYVTRVARRALAEATATVHGVPS